MLRRNESLFTLVISNDGNFIEVINLYYLEQELKVFKHHSALLWRFQGGHKIVEWTQNARQGVPHVLFAYFSDGKI